MKITTNCPHCDKEAITKSEFTCGSTVFITLQCGHSIVETLGNVPVKISGPIPETKSPISHEVKCSCCTICLGKGCEYCGNAPRCAYCLSESLDKINPDEIWKTDPKWKALTNHHIAFPYQKEGVEFIQGAKFKAIVGDEPGVGKTVQAILTLRHNPELLPAAVFVPAATLYQWAKEFVKWGFETLPLPVLNKNLILPGFDIYICSMDILPTGSKDKISAVDRFCKLGLKTIVIDECQKFKDASSARTKALITLITRAEIQNRIFLSGTVIKNNAAEYFVPLNLVDPKRFNSLVDFKRRWLIQNSKGIYDRIAPWKLEEFHKVTSAYIIRRLKKDVLKDLPELFVTPEVMKIDDPHFAARYNKALDLFSNFLNSGEKVSSTDILGYLAKIRRITGEAKIQFIVDYAKDFMDANPDEKLIIGVNHTETRNLITGLLDSAGYPAIQLGGEHSPQQKDILVQQFRADKRCMVLNTLAGGVGLDGLQIAHTAILGERCWSPSDENQFFSRLHRQGQENKVRGFIIEAMGTIDQWFAELLNAKGIIIGETLEVNWNLELRPSDLRDFAETVSTGRI